MGGEEKSGEGEKKFTGRKEVPEVEVSPKEAEKWKKKSKK